MVNKHFSRGCDFCRKQHTRCDETKPECKRCQARGIKCTGYRDVHGFIFVDHSQKVVTRSRRQIQKSRASPKDERKDHLLNTTLTKTVKPDPRIVSVCFFFNTYILHRPFSWTSRGHFDHLARLYNAASSTSSLTFAMETLACFSYSASFCLSCETPTHTRSIVQASAAMRSAVSDPSLATKDETLLAVLLLDFGEFLMNRATGKPMTLSHQKAAVTLVQLRGEENFESDVARSLLFATRSNPVRSSMCGLPATDQDLVLMARTAMENPCGLTTQFDGILATALYLHRRVLQAENSATRSQEQLLMLHQNARRLHDHLFKWHSNVPSAWIPKLHCVSSLPRSLCVLEPFGKHLKIHETYPAFDIAFVYNQGRCAKLLVLTMLYQCQRLLESEGQSFENTLKGHESAQHILNDICSSFAFLSYGSEPFRLGSGQKYSDLGLWYLSLMLDFFVWVLKLPNQGMDIRQADIIALEAYREDFRKRFVLRTI